MTLPSPRVTSSTWARLAQSRNSANAAAEATMIIRAPVIGLRCLIAGPTSGRLAMVRLLRIPLPAARRADRRRQRTRSRAAPPACLSARRSASAAALSLSSGAGNVQCPALRRVEQAADVVLGARNRRTGPAPARARRSASPAERRRRHRRAHRQRVARLADIAAGEARPAGPTRPASDRRCAGRSARPWRAAAPSAERHNRRDNASLRRPSVST